MLKVNFIPKSPSSLASVPEIPDGSWFVGSTTVDKFSTIYYKHSPEQIITISASENGPECNKQKLFNDFKSYEVLKNVEVEVNVRFEPKQ